LPAVSAQTASIYEHCVRALKHGHRLGSHGLPLMGTGDWNDGMNNVGSHGKGESVWNGWFFVTVLNAFAELAEKHSQPDDVKWCRDGAEQLRVALEANAWDGAWYRRAYFDDGTPLGSAQNDECQIDAIPQAWAVISGVANAERTRSAMDAVQQRLVRSNDKLIQLFDPPFDKGVLQPGYIKGYVPGIRENGGQYTHAATWVALATALQGRGDRAMELWNLINPVNHARTAKEAVAVARTPRDAPKGLTPGPVGNPAHEQSPAAWALTGRPRSWSAAGARARRRCARPRSSRGPRRVRAGSGG